LPLRRSGLVRRRVDAAAASLPIDRVGEKVRRDGRTV